MSSSTPAHARILVVDDTPAIHTDMRRILARRPEPRAMDDALAQLLGSPETPPAAGEELEFEIDSALQGEDALRMVEAAESAGRPYSLAFVDMRMPPGWDGLETTVQLQRASPQLQIVICTAYSDHDWSEIHRRVGQSGNVLILKKPFDGVEARQMAWTLAEKWRLARAAGARLRELQSVNAELKLEVERRARAEVQLAYDALHDALTDMPNRTLISDRIERALARAKRDAQYHFAVIFLDLDDFKVVNDSLGHAAGDHYLVQLSERITHCIRQSDCATRIVENAVARLGGDEFLVLLDGLRASEDASYVAERILEVVHHPLRIQNHELRPSASAGVALGSADYDDASALIRDADTALYRAKSVGKGGLVVFDQSLRLEALARLRVESDLRAAIRDGQLFLQYQPIVALSDLRVLGFEALVRWRHPEHGVIPPGEFVPMAEETGLILPLGEWVLRTACLQAAHWQQHVAGARELFVNVNFSSRQLMAPDFVPSLLRVLEETGLDRRDLHVEITESMLLPSFGPASRAVQEMKGERLEMHIDDFGTGFSSLAYLHRLPVSAVKLDRSFLRGLDGVSSGKTTIRAVIELAHARQLKVVAEGIESAEQLALLQELGCDMGQGFYFARPLDAELVEHSLLARQRFHAA